VARLTHSHLPYHTHRASMMTILQGPVCEGCYLQEVRGAAPPDSATCFRSCCRLWTRCSTARASGVNTEEFELSSGWRSTAPPVPATRILLRLRRFSLSYSRLLISKEYITNIPQVHECWLTQHGPQDYIWSRAAFIH
jgi:hypothetical protein